MWWAHRDCQSDENTAYEKAPWSGDNFRESILFAGKSARRFDVPGAPTRVVDVRLFAWYYKAPKRKSQS
jgi:hypothetical protein